jgi:CubicO group peptidase (beta-lactamase class C family)
MLSSAIAQDSRRLGADLEQFTQRFLFGPLGMQSSIWSEGGREKNFAYGLRTTLQDMARLGLLMLRGGVWSGERLLSAEWIYRMTHPAFEDANTGYGYLTWLNAADHHSFGGIWFAPPADRPQSPGPCAPLSLHRSYPHGLSGAANCNYRAPYSCTQRYDVGVWQAIGLGGQVIQGHPGLDMVIVGHNLMPGNSGLAAPARLWDAVRPAVVQADPRFKGNEKAFCRAYGRNEYAPDLSQAEAPR